MSLVRLRAVLATAVAAVACVAIAPRPSAAPTEPRFERLIARAIDPSDRSGASLPIEIVIERWSTDKEVDSLRDAMAHSTHQDLILALQRTRPRVGVLQYSGIQTSGDRARIRRSQVIQFARDIKTAKGRQVIVALGGERPPLGEHVGLAELRSANPKPELTLIDIRFAADGTAVGKVATFGKLAYNQKTRTFEVANYDREPVRLTDVRSEGFDGGFARRVGK